MFEITDLPLRMRAKITVSPKGCWEWQGTRLPKGYGQLYFRKKKFYTHRLAYEVAFEDPGELLVRHRCDNPPCCNPDHLLKGTVQDNSDDAVERGLTCKGEDNGTAKLTNEQVVEIRKRYAAGESQIALGKAFGVHHINICKIVRNLTWKTDGGVLSFAHRRAPKRKLSVEQEEFIRSEYLAGGVTYRQLSTKYSVASSIISYVVNGKYR